MNTKDREVVKNMCRYCVSKYRLLNNAPVLSNLICQLGKAKGLDIPAVRGILQVRRNGLNRQFAHCFNICNGEIIDTAVYQFALINPTIEGMFPTYVVGNIPDDVDYTIMSEIKYDSQFKFSEKYILNVLKELDYGSFLEPKRYSFAEDSMKENIIF